MLLIGIVPHAHVVNVLAGAMETASDPGLDTCELRGLNVLIEASTTSDAVKAKLKRLKERSETTLPIYRGEGGARTATSPEAQQIYDERILAVLDEFRKIRETLHACK